jgi:hypothetical protein
VACIRSINGCIDIQDASDRRVSADCGANVRSSSAFEMEQKTHYAVLWLRSIHAAGALNSRMHARARLHASDLSVALTHLDLAPSPDLFFIDPFGERNPKERVVTALDTINACYGLNTVYLGSIHSARQEAPTRIPFGPPPPLEEFDDTAEKLHTPMGLRGIRASDLPRVHPKTST